MLVIKKVLLLKLNLEGFKKSLGEYKQQYESLLKQKRELNSKLVLKKVTRIDSSLSSRGR